MSRLFLIIIFFLSIYSTLAITTTTKKPAIQWQSGNWAYGCDFINTKDLSNKKTTMTSCSSTCSSTTGCTHYTWTTYNGGTCWLKSGLATESNAIYTGNNTMICGIKPSKLIYYILYTFFKNNFGSIFKH